MSKEQKQQLKDNYGDYFNGSADLLTYFYKRAFNLLKCGGTLSFISSNKFMRTGYGLPLRNLLASKAQLLQVIDFGELPVFGAGIDVAIIIANKPETSSKHGEFIAAVVKDQNEIVNVGKVVSERGCKFAAGDLSDDGWLLESKAVRGLLERIEKVGIPLGRVIEKTGAFTGSRQVSTMHLHPKPKRPRRSFGKRPKTQRRFIALARWQRYFALEDNVLRPICYRDCQQRQQVLAVDGVRNSGRRGKRFSRRPTRRSSSI